jgi:hypothetical protein
VVEWSTAATALAAWRAALGPASMIPGAMHQRIVNELFRVSQQIGHRFVDFKASAACGCLLPVTA